MMSQVVTSTERKSGKLRNVELVQEATRNRRSRVGRIVSIDVSLTDPKRASKGEETQVLKQNLYHQEDWPPGPDGLP